MSSTSSPDLADSASALKEPGCEQSPSVRSTRVVGECSAVTGQTFHATTTSKPENSDPERQTSFAEDSHVKTYQLPDAGRDWMESEADFGASSRESLAKYERDSTILVNNAPKSIPNWLKAAILDYYCDKSGDILTIRLASLKRIAAWSLD